MLCKQETWKPTSRWIADLNIPPALHFRCAVEDRDPVYSAEPVPTLVFGARCFSWEPDLWSRYGQIARGWHRAAEMGGPVSTWYRSRAISPRTETTLPRGSKPVRSRGRLLPRVISRRDSSSQARATERTGPSGCCPGTIATVHSNVNKHRAAKRVRLAFDSHFEILFRSVSSDANKKKTGPSGGRDAAAPLLFHRIGANKRATAKYASSWPLTFRAKRVDSPSPTL